MNVAIAVIIESMIVGIRMDQDVTRFVLAEVCRGIRFRFVKLL